MPRKIGSRFKGEERICPICTTSYWVELNLLKKGKGKYCSVQCYNVSKKGKPTHNKGKKVPFKPHPWKIGQIPRSAFKKGLIPWNVGTKGLHPNPHKGEKTGRVPPNAIRPGQHISPATQFKKGLIPWNKNIADNSLSIQKERSRKSPEMKAWSRAVKERDNYTCLKCGERGGRLESDHILPFEFFIEFRLDINNGQTLCKKCHTETPTYGAKTRRCKKAYETFCMLS